MFGLTKREQRWKAEQEAAEVLAGLAAVSIRGVTDARVAEANVDAGELAELREKYNELLYAVGSKHRDETRHETALRYIKQAERSVSTGQQSVSGPNGALSGLPEASPPPMRG